MLLKRKNSYPTDYFIVNRRILIFAGLWIPTFSISVLNFLFKFYVVLVFLYVNMFYTATEFLSFFETFKHMEMFIKNINFALTHLMGCIKCIFWFVKGNEFKRILSVLESKEYHYDALGKFQPGIIFRIAKLRGIRYTLTFYFLAQLTVLSSYIPIVAQALIGPNYYEENGIMKLDKRLPYYSYIPFKYDTQWTLIGALMYQFFPVISYAYSIIGMDTLFMNIMNFIAAHLQVLQGAFETIRERCIQNLKNKNPDINMTTKDKLHNSDELEDEMNTEFKKMTKHMQTVIGVCEDIENIHKYLTLSQVLCTLFILCTSLFLVSTTPLKSKRFAGEFFYILTMVFEVILYCWFGNKVTSTAGEIPLAIWKSDWLQCSKQLSQNMLITMTRMAKPVYLTVGRFTPLTINTLVSIMKASYSFFAVLKNAKSEN